MWICLACLLIPSSWSVSICDEYIVLPYDILDVMQFDIMNEAIFVVACFSRYIFTPESTIAIMFLPG